MSAQILSRPGPLATPRSASWLRPALLAVAFVVGAVCPASARLICARLLLPDAAEQATNAICYIAGPGQGDAFLRVSLSGLRDGYSVSNSLYRGWSVTYPGTFTPEANCQARLYPSLGELPASLRYPNWDRVNYLLNHRQGTGDEVQSAIWYFLGIPFPPEDARFSPLSETAVTLIADAQENGAGFVPQLGQISGVIVDASAGESPVLLEVFTVADRMPTAGPDTFAVSQGSQLQLLPQQLLANDVDADGDPLLLVDVTLKSAQGGQLSFDGTNIAYLPPAGFVGADTFAYGLAAGPCGRALGAVTINVSPAPNVNPLAQADTATTERNLLLGIPAALLLANDTDPDGDALVVMAVSTNSNRGGQVALEGANLLYAPPAGFIGTDTFDYTVSDGRGGQATATVTITVVPPPNQPPVAVADEVATDEDVTLSVPAAALLQNDSDSNGDALNVMAVTSESTQGGSVLLDGANVIYVPAPGFEGMDTFTYTLSDGHGGTATATVTVTVRHVNHPPLAGVLTLTTTRNTPLTIALTRLMELSHDPDGDAVHLVGITPNSYGGGTALLSVSSVNYTPRVAQLGGDTFNFTVEDPSGARATGAVNIVIVGPALGVMAEEPVHNTQTGLFEQRVTVSNNGTQTLAAIQIDISGLPTNVVVWNASGTNGGIPFIRSNRTLEPGASVTVRIEYYIPDRRPIHPVITVDTAPAGSPKPASGTEGVAIDRGYMDTRIPGEPRYVIEFASTPGRIYTIIYSDDMKTWNTAVPAVTATANRTQWYDDGPPKTDRKPSEGTRFYRVIQSP